MTPEEIAGKLTPDAARVTRAMAGGDSPYSVALQSSQVSRALMILRRAGVVTPIDSKKRELTPLGLSVAAALRGKE